MSDAARPLIEMAGLCDTYVSGLGAIEDVGGGNYRLYLYVNQASHVDAVGAGQPERQVIAKVILPRMALPDFIGQIVTAAGKAFTVYGREEVPALN